MIKLISNKKYKKIIDQNDRLTKQILRQQNELNTLKNKIMSDETLLFTTNSENIKLKLENKRLKTILTKNKIKYNKENNKQHRKGKK